ncbi:MAG: hypothetical protein HKM04_09880 [Legionellales bacterium]|nr:hypothetical protein [Legionellales bacterium]
MNFKVFVFIFWRNRITHLRRSDLQKSSMDNEYTCAFLKIRTTQANIQLCARIGRYFGRDPNQVFDSQAASKVSLDKNSMTDYNSPQLGSVDNWFFEAKKERIEEKLVLV